MHTLSQFADKKLSKLQEACLFSHLFISRRGGQRQGRKWEGGREVRRSNLQACQLSSSWQSMTGAFGYSLFLQHGESSPLFQDLGSSLDQERWKKVMTTKSHITLLKAYAKWKPHFLIQFRIRAVCSWACCLSSLGCLSICEVKMAMLTFWYFRRTK